MNNKFDELTKATAQSATRRATPKKFGLGLAGMALACFGLANPGQSSGSPGPGSKDVSILLDPVGDARWSFDLYDGPLPPYLDIIQASITLRNGTFHFEVQFASDVPTIPSPGLTPAVNHLGITLGIQTDRSTAENFKLFGQTDDYRLNFLVGALYSFADSGLGLPLGWSGFLLDTAKHTVVALPMEIRGDTIIFETSGASLGNPGSFQWMATIECDSVPVPDEKARLVQFVDFAPDHGYANWPSNVP